MKNQNRFWIGIIIVSLIFLTIKIATYPHNTIFVDVPLLSLATALALKYRKMLTEKIKKIHLPGFALYLFFSIPFILFEENINCLPTGCKLIPSTLPILLIFILVLGILVKLFKAKTMALPIIIFSLFGLVFEITVGGLKGVLLFTPAGLFFSFWTALSYAFLTIIPLSILVADSSGLLRKEIK